MIVREPQVSTTDIDNRKQLECLYARRTTIDALIASLRIYDRFHPQREPDHERPQA
jgi:hypothetical protein